MKEIKQFKLSSGEQIICEILEWPNVDDDIADVVVRNIFQIVAATKPFDNNRYYTFVPWLVFQDEEDMFQVINTNHIVGEANPSNKLLEQYFIACSGDDANSDANQEDVMKRLDEYISKLRDAVESRSLDGGDSDGQSSKIITFPGGRTIH